ncbi:MAG: FtsH protease activity modulator HflK [Candidatus Krumholzibacteriota bacterium]|nr:FtsH protease activity modulator HflK [Candidatus Krumholzibacteriota bacterium]
MDMKVMVGGNSYNLSGGGMKNIIGGVIVLIILVSGLYSVGADEVGVILRFGKYVRSTDPGLHIKIPFGIESVDKVKVKKVFKQEFGFRTIKAGIKTQYSSKSYYEESIILTGDLNVAEVEWVVQYKVKDPYNYLFKIKDPSETLRAMSESVVRRVVGDRAVTEILTLGRIDIAKDVEVGLQELLDHFESGIQIVTVQLQNVNPPDPVRPAFNEVNRAKQDKETMINEAWEDYNKRIPRARGEAEQMIAEAEGYATKRVNQALGDASLFNQIYKEYRLAPDVTRRRLYLETLGEILPRMEEIYIVDEDQKSILPLLEIGKDRKGGDGK